MPRVSAEFRECRRRQILDAAAICFARKGLHATSMPDIFAESGLSSGAVYRYFSGRQEIITALLESIMQPVQCALREAVSREPALTVPQIVDLIIREMVTVLDVEDASSLIVQVWAESMRTPHLYESQGRDIADLHDALTPLLARLTPEGRVDPDASWAVLSLGLGTFISQTVLKSNATPTQTLVDELRTLLAAPEAS
ncbi:TetR/AcrR family transcriptional regulator [Streptomyces sp. NPDC056716]|uniref:TetR/AcrR family transcriptional regulator n=1 Tax=unclassified Streptomyces TaxID=2593676 RepID=UPI00369164EF